MSAYLSHVQAEAHTADLVEEARLARLARPLRGRRRPGRLRNSAARVLLGLAVRLDHGLRPASVGPSTPGPGS